MSKVVALTELLQEEHEYSTQKNMKRTMNTTTQREEHEEDHEE